MRIPIFSPAPKKRFSRFDLWVYRLFYRRWSQHFIDYPDVRKSFIANMQEWDAQRAEARAPLTLVETANDAQ